MQHESGLLQIVNFMVKKFPKQQRREEYPLTNNAKVPKVCKNFTQTRLSGEFEHVT